MFVERKRVIKMDEWINQNKAAVIIGASIIAAAVVLAPNRDKYYAVPDHKTFGVYVVDKSSGRVKKCKEDRNTVQCTGSSR